MEHVILGNTKKESKKERKIHNFTFVGCVLLGGIYKEGKKDLRKFTLVEMFILFWYIHFRNVFELIWSFVFVACVSRVFKWSVWNIWLE